VYYVYTFKCYVLNYLQDIASDPDDDFVFHVSNFSVLNTIRNILAIKTCAVQPEDYVADTSVKSNTNAYFINFSVLF